MQVSSAVAAARLRGTLIAMKPRRILLHAGRVKTGSTFLQAALMEAALDASGWLFPRSLLHIGRFQPRDRGVRLNGHAILSRLSVGMTFDTGLLNAFHTEALARPGHSLILSAEDLGRDPRDNRMQALGEIFEGFDVEIVMYLRRPSTWINSVYIERITSGHGREFRSYDDLASDLFAAARTAPFIAQLRQWKTPPKLVFRNYDTARSRRGLLGDFARAFDLPRVEAPERVDINRSPDFAAARGIRVFNALSRGVTGDVYEDLYGQLLDNLVTLEGEMRGSFLTEEQAREIDARWFAENRALVDDGHMDEADYAALIDGDEARILPDAVLRGKS